MAAFIVARDRLTGALSLLSDVSFGSQDEALRAVTEATLAEVGDAELFVLDLDDAKPVLLLRVAETIPVPLPVAAPVELEIDAPVFIEPAIDVSAEPAEVYDAYGEAVLASAEMDVLREAERAEVALVELEPEIEPEPVAIEPAIEPAIDLEEPEVEELKAEVVFEPAPETVPELEVAQPEPEEPEAAVFLADEPLASIESPEIEIAEPAEVVESIAVAEPVEVVEPAVVEVAEPAGWSEPLESAEPVQPLGATAPIEAVDIDTPITDAAVVPAVTEEAIGEAEEGVSAEALSSEPAVASAGMDMSETLRLATQSLSLKVAEALSMVEDAKEVEPVGSEADPSVFEDLALPPVEEPIEAVMWGLDSPSADAPAPSVEPLGTSEAIETEEPAAEDIPAPTPDPTPGAEPAAPPKKAEKSRPRWPWSRTPVEAPVEEAAPVEAAPLPPEEAPAEVDIARVAEVESGFVSELMSEPEAAPEPELQPEPVPEPMPEPESEPIYPMQAPTDDAERVEDLGPIADVVELHVAEHDDELSDLEAIISTVSPEPAPVRGPEPAPEQPLDPLGAAVDMLNASMPPAVSDEPHGYHGDGSSVGMYTCEDCVYADTCPKKGQESPATCGLFQWRA